MLALLTVAAGVTTVLVLLSGARVPDVPALPPVAGAGPTISPAPGAPVPAAAGTVDLAAAVAAAEEAAADAGPSRLDLAVAVRDRVTGAVESGEAGDEVFNAASLAKVITAVDALDQRARGAVSLDTADLRTLRSALGPSSDPAMNTLWSGFGGAAGVTRVAGRLGLGETTAPDDPSQWGEVQTSARDVVALLDHVRDLPAAERDVLIGALTDPPARAADGFDQGYGLLGDGAGGAEPVKQGWLCCLEDSVDMHSAGIVGDRWVVAVLTNQPRGWDRARATVDAAVGSLRESLGDTPAG